MIVKLPYWQSITLVASADNLTYTEYLFSVNSAIDPNITGTSHYPRGFPQWAALYRQYLIRGCSYNLTLRVSDNSNSDTVANYGMWGIHPAGLTDDAYFDSIDDFMERAKDYGDKYKYWGRTSSTGMSSTSTGFDYMYRSGSHSIKGYVSCGKLGRLYSPEVQWPADYWAPIASNPPVDAQQTFTIWAASLPQGTGTSGAIETENLPDLLLEVKLIYYIEFGDPTEVAQSS